MSTEDSCAFVILTLRFRKEGASWMGECDELGTATDGRTLSKVRTELAKLVALHMEGLERAGERERVFQERGIRLYRECLPSEVERRVPVSAEQEALLELRPISVAVHEPQPVAG